MEVCTLDAMCHAIIHRGELEQKVPHHLKDFHGFPILPLVKDYFPSLYEKLRRANIDVEASQLACYARQTGGLQRLALIRRY